MKLSIIIPAYNEQDRIAPTILNMKDHLEGRDYDYEIIVMVNGSTDQTYETAVNVTAGWDKVKVRELLQPGKGNAVKRGVLDYASGDIILFMDADNATPISEIESFFQYFERGYAVVIGSRYLNSYLMKKRPPVYRMILSRLGNAAIRALAVPGIVDTQLGFKAFTRQAALDIFSAVTINAWAFDIELLAIARQYGYQIKEVPVIWNEPGGSHVSLKAYVESLRDLFKIQWRIMTGAYQPEENYNKEKQRALSAYRRKIITLYGRPR
jgi:dolichyl-phosphate beta-glucosyltransferase